MEYIVEEIYTLAISDGDGFTYVAHGDEYGYGPFEFITLDDAKEYLGDMIETDGVVIIRETRQIVC